MKKSVEILGGKELRTQMDRVFSSKISELTLTRRGLDTLTWMTSYMMNECSIKVCLVCHALNAQKFCVFDDLMVG